LNHESTHVFPSINQICGKFRLAISHKALSESEPER
jgi:hypothetical protein